MPEESAKGLQRVSGREVCGGEPVRKVPQQTIHPFQSLAEGRLYFGIPTFRTGWEGWFVYSICRSVLLSWSLPRYKASALKIRLFKADHAQFRRSMSKDIIKGSPLLQDRNVRVEARYIERFNAKQRDLQCRRARSRKGSKE